MSEYRMDIVGTIELADYSSIYDYIAIVNNTDNLTISIEDVENESINIICNMLEKSNFKIDLNKDYDTKKCFIKASRDINT
ncbi:hypothetical protein N4T77_08035 [Clostridium sp. CX1]|uniref:Uncharacterized protein n=1 Tax=Clostridium tanneri TaxID=3037988 RepID=A0ABU4JPY5_9CLOT|nr:MULTISPECIES: hypothetical protein [unclassified Clostridium]MCT8976543.1 hypothetical protein [Clostridium sp. CX1]MDW8800209.1 hypothetical protein [Clostridium sp. A1-XYC3]